MNNKIITYEEYNKRIDQYNQSIAKGFIPIVKRNKIKIGLGLVCLGIAIIPNGLGFIFYPLSFSLIGLSLFDVRNKIFPELKRKIKNKIRGIN